MTSSDSKTADEIVAGICSDHFALEVHAGHEAILYSEVGIHSQTNGGFLETTAVVKAGSPNEISEKSVNEKLPSSEIDDELGVFCQPQSFEMLTELLDSKGAVPTVVISSNVVTPEDFVGQKRPSSTAQSLLQPIASKRRKTASESSRQQRQGGAVHPSANIPSKCSKESTEPFLIPSTTFAPSTAKQTEAGACQESTCANKAKSPTKPKTEEDYRATAKAAIMRLIEDACKETGSMKAVDLSTAHINALTKSSYLRSSLDAEDTEAGGGKDTASRRSTLSASERAKRTRDRNKEHAKKTRLRKKVYLEELQETLKELVRKRDVADLEGKNRMKREAKQRDTQFRVMESFLNLRARGAKKMADWEAILHESFTLSLPLTPYRQMVNKGSRRDVQVLQGTSEVMQDASHLATFLQELGNQTTPASLKYHIDRKDFLVGDCSAMFKWSATLVPPDEKCPLDLRGTLHSQFNSDTKKLISSELFFDTQSVMAHIRHSEPSLFRFHYGNGRRSAKQPPMRLSSEHCPSKSKVGSVTVSDNDNSSDEEVDGTQIV